MGKRGKERKRKRAGLSSEPGSTTEIDGDDPLGGLSEGDVATTIRTLETLGRDAALFKSRPFKKLRAALAPCALALVGQDATDDRQRRKLERPVQDEDERRRVMDRDAKNRTALRKERLDRLATAGLVADGPALAPQLLLTNGNNEESLKRAVACYCCKAPFSDLHHFYAALCPACASLNFEKRTQTADLRGRGALVTGARVKIGFRVALNLLRAGATVVATSRFPADAAARYAAESDAEEWRDRLRVVGCDFRDLGAVEALCAAVPELLGCGLDVLVCVEINQCIGCRVDGVEVDAAIQDKRAVNLISTQVLVNNACQTVRRPPQYYAQTVSREAKLRKAIGNASLPLLEGPAIADANEPTADVSLMRSWTAKAPTTSDPALRALLCVAPGDDVRDDAAFPEGRTDGNADLSEQLDLRRDNSWTQKIDQISTPELAEVFAINALAPFVINSKLTPALKDGASNERRRFVVNVSAMEGKFYRHKQPTHPHTCRLRVLSTFLGSRRRRLLVITQEHGQGRAEHDDADVRGGPREGARVHDGRRHGLDQRREADRPRGADSASSLNLNATRSRRRRDGGVPAQVEHARRHAFQTPLDEIDAAARILDPVLGGHEPPLHGVFLKDYAPCEW